MQKYKGRSKNQIRQLKQYKELSDEEFEEVWTKELLDSEPSEEFEERIEKKLEEFSDDYDLSDLKINDRASLRALIQSLLTLEDYEQVLYKLRQDDLTQGSLQTREKLGKIMSDLRSDISKLQDDLNIKRKIRKSDKETSVINEIEDLKRKAREFYEQKACYILCDCGMLLATVWTLYTDEPQNEIILVCNRKLDDGEICGKIHKVNIKELYDNKLTNHEELLPESML